MRLPEGEVWNVHVRRGLRGLEQISRRRLLHVLSHKHLPSASSPPFCSEASPLLICETVSVSSLRSGRTDAVVTLFSVLRVGQGLKGGERSLIRMTIVGAARKRLSGQCGVELGCGLSVHTCVRVQVCVCAGGIAPSPGTGRQWGGLGGCRDGRERSCPGGARSNLGISCPSNPCPLRS